MMTTQTILKLLGTMAGAVTLICACARPAPPPQAAVPPPAAPQAESLRLGDARMQEGRLVEALSIYREGLKDEPKSPELKERMAVILDQLGRTNEAMDTYGDALRLAPDNERLHLALAHLLFRTENFPTAVVHFKQAERVNPLNPSAYRWAAMCFIKMDRWEDAQKEIEAEARVRPGDPDTKRTLDSVRESVANKRAAERRAAISMPRIPLGESTAVNLGVIAPKAAVPQVVEEAPPAKTSDAPSPEVSVFDIPEPPTARGISVD